MVVRTKKDLWKRCVLSGTEWNGESGDDRTAAEHRSKFE